MEGCTKSIRLSANENQLFVQTYKHFQKESSKQIYNKK